MEAMPGSCLDPLALRAYQEGLLPSPVEQEALEHHVADCPHCRKTLLLLGSASTYPDLPLRDGTLERLKGLGRGTAPRRARWGMAAAALLALAGAGIWLAVGPRLSPPHPGPSALPAPSDAFPAGRLGNPAQAQARLLRGGDLLLEAGASVTIPAPGRRLRGEAGTFWLEASGIPLTLELPGLEVRLDQGVLAVRLPPRPPPALLPQAQAEEDGGRIWLLSGSARLLGEGNDAWMQEGGSLAREEHRWRDVTPAPGEVEALWRRKALAASALRGPDLLGGGSTPLSDRRPFQADGGNRAGGYRWVCVLRDRSPSTELGLSFPIEGGRYRWIPGLGKKVPAPREVLELAWDGEWLRGRIDGRLSFSVPRDRLPELRLPAKPPGWGVDAWRGEVVLESCRLLEWCP